MLKRCVVTLGKLPELGGDLTELKRCQPIKYGQQAIHAEVMRHLATSPLFPVAASPLEIIATQQIFASNCKHCAVHVR